MVLSRLFHRINLSISAAVLSLVTIMPGEAAALTLSFTEYAGNFGIYGGIDAALDVTVNNGQALWNPHEFYSDRQWFWMSSSRQLMAASRSANRKVSRGSSMTLRPMKIVESTTRSLTVLA